MLIVPIPFTCPLSLSIEVLLHRVDSATPQTSETRTPLRVLPTMTVKVFRLKARKVFKVAPQANLSVWVMMPDVTWVEIRAESDRQELDWVGLEEGTNIACCIVD